MTGCECVLPRDEQGEAWTERRIDRMWVYQQDVNVLIGCDLPRDDQMVVLTG